jgi:hypothetical protein
LAPSYTLLLLEADLVSTRDCDIALEIRGDQSRSDSEEMMDRNEKDDQRNQ